MKQFEKIIAIGMLIFAIGFNLWLYRLEPMATIDPNDNAFQFALVDRTNQVWSFAQQKCAKNLSFVICHLSFLVDHWVPNWAEGYNLPFYYSHVPQILIVGSYRLINSFIHVFNYSFISLFTYYHWIIYLLLSLFPLTVFLSLRLIRLPWLIAGFGALLASHLSTDGLYGLDPPSFLWRGYGLSSQLFGMIWMPMAIAYAWRYFATNSKHEIRSTKQVKNSNAQNSKRLGFGIWNLGFVSDFDIRISDLFPAVFFLTATAMGHLGLGIMAMLSLVPLAFAQPLLMALHQESPSRIYEVTMNQLTKLLILSTAVIFFLSYWVVPIFLADNYHNISFWDPPWKFASYGAKETITRLFNGDLFDWGRGPWMTALVVIGLIASLWPMKSEALSTKSETNSNDQNSKFKTKHVLNFEPLNFDIVSNFGFRISYFPFALLFLFWLLLYFGRGTWGPLIDLIPGMKEFHLSRFIVGVHVAGLFLVPIGVMWLLDLTTQLFARLPHDSPRLVGLIGLMGLMGLMGLPIYKQTIEYSRHNDRLIKQSIDAHASVKNDEEALFTAIRALPPGRVFAGRGGGFGKDFRVSETPYYMHLSTYGIPTTLWLPETWSPNSDVEQYFNENNARDYDLFGIRYVAAPPKEEPKKFWKLIAERPTWKLYEIELTGDAEGGIPRDAQPSSLDSSLMDKVDRNASIAREGNRGRTRQKPIGYFTTGVRAAVVATDKRSYGNVVRFWIQPASPNRGEAGAHAKGLYPELTFAKDYPRTNGLPNFKMLDEVTYKIPDGSTHNLFAQPPVYLPPEWESTNTTNPPGGEAGHQILPIIKSEMNAGDMIFSAKVDVPDNCTECIVVLKQSFHPNWRATIDGKATSTFTVFPFYLATLVPAGPPGGEASPHEIVFSYEPGRLKVGLLLLEMIVLLYLGGRWIIRRANHHLQPASAT